MLLAVTHLIAGEPAGVLQFLGVDGDLFGQCFRVITDHDVAGERPGLAGMVMHRAAGDADFFQHFAADSFFQRFAGFQEARQRRIHRAAREAGGVAEDRPIPLMHQHDHRRVRPRKMLGLARRALHHVAGGLDLTHAAADAAELVARAPVHQAAGMGQHGGFRVRHAPADRAQIDEGAKRFGNQRQRIIQRADVDREHRLVVQQAKERPDRVAQPHFRRGLPGDVDGFRLARVHARDQVAVAPDGDEQAFGVVELLLDPRVIFAPRGDAVERG